MGKHDRVVLTANHDQIYAYVVSAASEQDALDKIAAIGSTSNIIGINDGSGYPIKAVAERPQPTWYVPTDSTGQWPSRYLRPGDIE